MTGIKITLIDEGILIGYFVLVLVIGYVLARRNSTGQDYFLAGNRLGWTAIGFSLFASNISSASIIGLTGQAYSSGISIANYEWMATLILVFMAIFIIPLYLKNKISTVPQFLELRYSPFVRYYYSFVTIVLTIIVDIASSLFAGALVIHFFFPNISVLSACYAMALISGIYTAAGGLAAVVYTDTLQAIILLIGSSIMLFAILGQHDFSWSAAISQIDEPKLHFMRPINDENLPWLGTLLGVPILGFYYWTTNQYVVQRILGAKSISHAQWGAFLGGFLKLLVLFLIVFPGVMCLPVFPDLSNPDMVYPTMLLNLIPDGVKGIVLAGLIAAIMSSVDSALNGTSTLIVMDFIRPRNPGLSERQLMRFGRIATLSVMIIAGLWAPIIQNFEGLFNYLQQVLSFSVPPVVCIFILGIFWRRGTAIAAKYTLIFGHLVCFASMYLVNTGSISIHFTIMAAILLLFSICLYVFVSLRRPQAIFPVENTTFSWKRLDQNFSGHKKILAGLLLILTLIVLTIYW